MATENDLETLQGTWNITSLEVDGNSVPEAFVSSSQITVTGRRFVASGMGATYEGEMQIDETSRPGRLTMKFDTGPETGSSSYGIYELAVNSWKLCLTLRGGVFPTEFRTWSESGLALETLVRAGVETGVSSNRAESGNVEVGKQGRSGERNQSDTGSESVLIGKWKMVAGMIDGHQLEKSMVAFGTRVCSSDQVTVAFGGKVFLKARYTANPNRIPMEIDYQFENGSEQLGIYETDGSVVSFCMAAPGKARPTDFESNPGDGRTVSTWTKVT